MQISLKHIPIHPALKGHIGKLWVFESSGRIPDMDMKLVVPNGMMKLVIPFRNGFIGQRGTYLKPSAINQMTLVGVNDTPFIVDTQQDVASGTIGVEFKPHGAYRFFNVKQSELRNQIFHTPEVIGSAGKEIEERMAGTEILEQKIKILQDYLLRLFLKTETDNIFEYCINMITHTLGQVSIKELERKTGYSARWLNRKFDEKIGISPKNLCAISRFQFVFQTLVNNPDQLLLNKSYYNVYYDQSHFIKEFKRFTGMAPSKFKHHDNDFGKISYLK
jgi:AraC-like DNA-binding protein